MGYFRGLTHGAIIGAVLGILYAPEAGIDMRRRVANLLGQAPPPVLSDGAAGQAPATAARRRSTGNTETRTRRS